MRLLLVMLLLLVLLMSRMSRPGNDGQLRGNYGRVLVSKRGFNRLFTTSQKYVLLFYQTTMCNK